MSIQRLPIKDFLLRSKNTLVLDVRSPGEYAHAHVPGALNLPLFSDEERKIVGTTYKQVSREAAIKTGLDLFGPKMRRMVEITEEWINNYNSNQNTPNNNTVFVYCWRGGMRSAAVAWLLDLYGFRVYSLAGGYKSFRNYILDTFKFPFHFRILGGFTGSGKTEVLNQLAYIGEPVIDLEKIASHKGSAFGAYKMGSQPSQEMFENLLGWELNEKAITGLNAAEDFQINENEEKNYIWLEDESQRIGNLNIPGALWDNMRNSPVVFLEVPFEERLDHITQEYGEWDIPKLEDSVQRISKRLGGLETKNTLAFLQEGNKKEAFRILLHYYDKRYLKGLHNREQLDSLLLKVNCESVTAGNARLLTKYLTV